MLTLKDLIEKTMELAEEKGFGTHPSEINTPEKLALLHSEVTEAFEAYRHGKIDGRDGFKEELADVIIRAIHLCGIYDINIEEIIQNKLKINMTRNWDWKKEVDKEHKKRHNTWTTQLAKKHVHNFENFTPEEQFKILETLNQNYSPERFNQQLAQKHSAIKRNEETRSTLNTAKKKFPPTLQANPDASPKDLANHAIMLTAGGDGLRLKQSLTAQDYPTEKLQNFTKPTFPLPNFPNNTGTLQANLILISHIAKEHKLDIPVIVTTGPEGSQTAKIIPRLIKENNNFGLSHIKVIPQKERLHLTNEDKVLIKADLSPATNPDETGGPIMSLKPDILDWLNDMNVKKVILLQATGLFNPDVFSQMASAAKDHDCVVVGVRKDVYDENQFFGTPITLEKDGHYKLEILETQVLNEETRKLQDPETNEYLPINSGLYVFDTGIIRNQDLPDYATPAKEITPDLPPAPKVGYAATDIVELAQNPVVLSITKDSYAVIKNFETIAQVEEVGKRHGIDKLCEF